MLVAASVLAAQRRLDLLPVLLVAWVGASVGGIGFPNDYGIATAILLFVIVIGAIVFEVRRRRLRQARQRPG